MHALTSDKIQVNHESSDHNSIRMIWPNRDRPVVFHHVEGAEKSLVITSSDGHEASKSNSAERDHAVSLNAPNSSQNKFGVYEYSAKLSYSATNDK